MPVDGTGKLVLLTEMMLRWYSSPIEIVSTEGAPIQGLQLCQSASQSVSQPPFASPTFCSIVRFDECDGCSKCPRAASSRFPRYPAHRPAPSQVSRRCWVLGGATAGVSIRDRYATGEHAGTEGRRFVWVSVWFVLLVVHKHGYLNAGAEHVFPLFTFFFFNTAWSTPVTARCALST